MYCSLIIPLHCILAITAAETAPYGDLPSWFSAIGTVGAFVVALYLLWLSIEDRRKIHRKEIQSSCRSVSAWYDLGGEKPVIWVQNLGREAVYDLVVYVGNADVDFHAPCDNSNYYTEVVFGIMPPGGRLDCTVEKACVSGAPFPDLPAIELEFTDSNQVHWRRGSNGNIQPVKFRRPFD